MTAVDVYRWALQAQPGQKVVYFKSDPRDRWADRSTFGPAYQAHDTGLVFLAQRRVRRGPHAGWLYYEATRISKGAAKHLRLFPSVGLSYVPVPSTGRLADILA